MSKKILITGMNKLQVTEDFYKQQQLQVIPSHTSLLACLRDMGYEVTQRAVVVGEDLKDYDHIIVFIHNPSGFAGYVYNALWAIYNRPDCIMAFDDWQTDSIYKGITDLKDVEKLFRPYVKDSHKDIPDDIEKYSSEFIKAVEIIESKKNKMLISAFSGGDLSLLLDHPNLYQYRDQVPYLLKLQKVPRRFVGRFLTDNSLQLQFGAGVSNAADEFITPNPENVGIGLPYGVDRMTTAYDPSNFMYTKTYGIAPSNTTLTVRYLTGGGVESNVPANDLNKILGNVRFLNTNLNSVTANTIYNSLAVTNPLAADGGGDGDSIEEIRQNSSANFATQLRNVTQNDYLVRALSMPAKYGVVSKAYIEPTKAQSISAGESQSVLDLYVLSYNVNNQLTTASPALKQNITTYLSQYRMVNDSVNIKDGFIINIGVNFDIIVLPNYNSNQILSNCILALQDYFAIDKWQINQPIILRDIYILLDKIEGVQTVKTVTISNLVGENLGYSPYAYDIKGATQANVIYPSLDPSIFEVKYPNQDIQGRVVPL